MARMWRRIALTLLSAVLFAAALPNEVWLFGNPLFAPIALAGYYLALRGLNRYRTAARLGLLFGAVSTVLVNYWLVNFGDFSVWTLGGVTLGFVGFHSLLSCYLLWALKRPVALRPLVVAVVWTAYEYLVANGYLGYPWAMAAYPLGGLLPLIQHADILGIWGLSFLVSYANAGVAELVALPTATAQSPRDRRRGIHLVARHAAALGLLVTAALVYGAVRLGDTPEPDTELRMVLVQQNSDSWVRGQELETLQRLQQLTRDAVASSSVRPELVAWSETSLRRPYIDEERFYGTQPAGDPFIPFLNELGIPLLTGAPYRVPNTYDAMNSALLIDPDGTVEDFYGKQHPVPFAEHVPLWEVPAVRRFFQEVVGLPAVWIKGSRPTIFTLKRQDAAALRFATPICFEDAFSYVLRDFTLRGADVFVNLTNNAWSKTRTAQTQHFVAARFRAVENRRTLVRSTNGGYSAVVDPWGRVPAALPMFEATSLVVDVPVYTDNPITPYTRFGDLFPVLCLVLVATGLIGTALPAIREHRRRR